MLIIVGFGKFEIAQINQNEAGRPIRECWVGRAIGERNILKGVGVRLLIANH